MLSISLNSPQPPQVTNEISDAVASQVAAGNGEIDVTEMVRWHLTCMPAQALQLPLEGQQGAQTSARLPYMTRRALFRAMQAMRVTLDVIGCTGYGKQRCKLLCAICPLRAAMSY